MTQTKKIKIVIASYAGAALLAACSQHMQEISQEKSDLKQQKDFQMQMVDNRTQELKHNVETNKKLALQNIREQKRALESQLQALDAEQTKINASAEYANQNLSDQAAVCKTKIKANLNSAEANWDKYQNRLDTLDKPVNSSKEASNPSTLQ